MNDMKIKIIQEIIDKTPIQLGFRYGRAQQEYTQEQKDIFLRYYQLILDKIDKKLLDRSVFSMFAWLTPEEKKVIIEDIEKEEVIIYKKLLVISKKVIDDMVHVMGNINTPNS